MTIIGTEIRGLPVLGDVATTTPGDAAALTEMFGEIIAGMAGAVGADSVVKEDGTAIVSEEPEAQTTTDPNAAASVVQLLALTVKQQAKALAGDPEAEAETPAEEQPTDQPTGQCIEDVPILGAPLAVAVPQAAPRRAVVTSDGPQPAAPVVVKPQVQQATEELPVSLPAEPKEKTPNVALAVADLLKAAQPLSTRTAQRPIAAPTAPVEDALPAAPSQEARSIVQNLVSSLQAAAPLPYDIAAPADILEPQALDPQIDAAEFAIQHQLDMSAEGEWLDQLAQDIARTAGEGGTLRFKLNPENLGSLRVEITPHAAGSAVRLTADTDAARAIIADAQPRLVAEARAAGLRIAETHVDLSGQNSSGDPRRQNAAFEETPLRTARFLRDQDESDGKPTPNRSERYA